MNISDSSRDFLNPETMPKPPGFSQVARTHGGTTVYLSGQVARAADGHIVGLGDAAAQGEQVFANLAAGLEAVGANFDNVVKLTYFLLDMDDFAAVREARDRYINTAQPPASSAVQVSGLVSPGILVEIEAIAHMDDETPRTLQEGESS